VVVNFWATWCEPCKQELPMLQQLAESHPDTLTVLGINLREDESLVASFLDDFGLTFPILMNPDDATVLAYQVMGLPQTLIVNPAGEVVFRKFGPITAEDLAIVG
jgi:thiol-disulfide isomerase/thioredoxin